MVLSTSRPCTTSVAVMSTLAVRNTRRPNIGPRTCGHWIGHLSGSEQPVEKLEIPPLRIDDRYALRRKGGWRR